MTMVAGQELSSISLPLGMACSSALIIEPSPLMYFIFTNQGKDCGRRPRIGRPCGTNDVVVFAAGGGGDGGNGVAAASVSACRGHFIVLPYWPLAI